MSNDKKLLGNKASYGGYQYRWSPILNLPKDIGEKEEK